MAGSFSTFLFRHRSYTPIPLLAILIAASRTTPAALLAGASVAAIGEGIRVWALRHTGPKTRTHRKIRVDDLVMTGPYSIVRNPLYVGNFILGTGMCVASGLPAIIPVFVVLFGIQYALIIRAEEEFLRGAIGDPYRVYCEQVPRILPRIHGYRAGDRRFPFREILPRELNTITAAETVLALLGLRILFPDLPSLLG
jgi:protein-S-isoprenylcysteine O-methyltransferase Ste14